MTEWISQKVGARRPDPLTDFPSQGNGNRADPLKFDLPLHQTDGLVTDPSGGGKDGHIHAFIF